MKKIIFHIFITFRSFRLKYFYWSEFKMWWTREPLTESEYKEHLLKYGFSSKAHLRLEASVVKIILNDEQFLLQLSERYQVLCRISNEKLIKDEKFVKKIIKNQPMDLQYAPFHLQKDLEIIEECVKKNFKSFAFVVPELRNDFDFVMKIAEIEFRIFKFSSFKIRSSPELMRKAVEKDKRFLQYIQEPASSKIDIFQDLIEENGDLVKHFNPYCVNKELWMISCKSSATAFEHIRYWKNLYKPQKRNIRM
jgi:hypothetical protein